MRACTQNTQCMFLSFARTLSARACIAPVQQGYRTVGRSVREQDLKLTRTSRAALHSPSSLPLPALLPVLLLAHSRVLLPAYSGTPLPALLCYLSRLPSSFPSCDS